MQNINDLPNEMIFHFLNQLISDSQDISALLNFSTLVSPEKFSDLCALLINRLTSQSSLKLIESLNKKDSLGKTGLEYVLDHSLRQRLLEFLYELAKKHKLIDNTEISNRYPPRNLELFWYNRENCWNILLWNILLKNEKDSLVSLVGQGLIFHFKFKPSNDPQLPIMDLNNPGYWRSLKPTRYGGGCQERTAFAWEDQAILNLALKAKNQGFLDKLHGYLKNEYSRFSNKEKWMIAILCNQKAEIIELLPGNLQILIRGEDSFRENFFRWTIALCNRELLQWFIESFPPLNANADRDRLDTLLREAVKSSNLSVVQFLLQNQAAFNQKSNGDTPLLKKYYPITIINSRKTKQSFSDGPICWFYRIIKYISFIVEQIVNKINNLLDSWKSTEKSNYQSFPSP